MFELALFRIFMGPKVYAMTTAEALGIVLNGDLRQPRVPAWGAGPHTVRSRVIDADTTHARTKSSAKSDILHAEQISIPIPAQLPGRSSYSLNTASSLVGVVDVLILLATGVVIYSYFIGWDHINIGLYILAMIVPSFAAVAALKQAGLYEVGAICNPTDQLPKIIATLALTFLVCLALAFALKISDAFSRSWVFSWFLSSALLLCVARILWQIPLLRWAKKGLVARSIVIVGASEQAIKFIDQLNLSDEPWLKITGIFDDRRAQIGSTFMQLPVLGTMDDLITFARESQVDDIVVTLPWDADKRLRGIIKKLEELPVNIRIGADLAGFLRERPTYCSIAGVPMLNIVSRPFDGWKYVIKQTEDKIIGLLLLILFSPVMAVIAAAIKLESPGPVFFRQKRYGFNNELINIYKFRTMNHHLEDQDGEIQTIRKDPRVTKFGALLRHTSLDELPQLFNVLKGEMSIVGPRPHPTKTKAAGKLFQEVVREYSVRHKVKPGITGWAQINGWRGETDTKRKIRKRVECDLYYIENWSLLLDLRILAQTAFIGLVKKNAY